MCKRTLVVMILSLGLSWRVPGLLLCLAFALIVTTCSKPAHAETNWWITSLDVRDMDYYAVSNGTGYALVVTNAGLGVERRCYRDGHHFLTILNDGGILALRPHPGVDRNGWGSTLYLQPFLPGAVLRGSSITDCTAYPDRIEAGATGLVSRGTSDQYGRWELALTCAYDRLNKRLTAAGLY
ncbi:MAG: hypothetical protein HQ559_11935, partial [Lentisphaerae bacterium]|nr:hypothetical protein [Lentisphaerota bacterium]